MVLIAFYTDFFYNVVIAWALHFFFASFTGNLPWMSCDNDWNTENCHDPYTLTRTDANSTILNATLSGENFTSLINVTAKSNATRVSPAQEYFE